jgi:hypothetical protein
VIVAGSSALATPSPATTQATVLYLDLEAGTCAKQVTTKRFLVLPCSDGTHQYEPPGHPSLGPGTHYRKAARR